MADGRGRRSIRLPGYDYTQPGAYFVTICTHRREPLFGAVVGGRMDLSLAGQIATLGWHRLPRTFPHTTLDEFVIMPDHVHGIIFMDRCRGEALDRSPLGRKVPPSNASPLPSNRPRGTTTRSLAAAIQNYQSICARRINQLRRTPGRPVWQRNYYEHVIRGEGDLRKLREYILANPPQWQEDLGNISTT